MGEKRIQTGRWVVLAYGEDRSCLEPVQMAELLVLGELLEVVGVAPRLMGWQLLNPKYNP